MVQYFKKKLIVLYTHRQTCVEKSGGRLDIGGQWPKINLLGEGELLIKIMLNTGYL